MRSKNNRQNLPSRLALSTAVAAALLSGYGGRKSYAGSCNPLGGGIYSCSGAANNTADTTQNISTTPLTVTTTAGFGIDTSTAGGYALQLRNTAGPNGLVFEDNYNSTIVGANGGIFARNDGSGSLSITSTGNVTGNSRDGIYAYNSTNSTADISISAATVTGEKYGIRARNLGAGALSVTATGTVRSNRYDGIFADNTSLGTNLTINTAAVYGERNGIDATNEGAGALTITSSGTVTGNTRHGIRAYQYGTDLTIETAAVTGAETGILAENYGSGVLSITSSGAVTANTMYGIRASNNGTDLTISTAVVYGGRNGINAANNGTGVLSITSTGTVTGNTRDGISASNSGTNLTINTAAVYGGHDGIDATNDGTGALSITSTGTVTGNNYHGIRATNSKYGTDLTINTAAVTGNEHGIETTNSGTGALSITSTGTVTGNNYDGIRATNSGTDLTINTVAVSGGETGIFARNSGSGSTSITSTGTVTGTTSYGIFAKSQFGTDLTINTATVSGNSFGIRALNYGTGSLSITTSGPITGGSDAGIYAANRGTGPITITTNDTVTGHEGIKVDGRTNNSPATINANSSVTGTDGFAIIFNGDGNDTLNLGPGAVINGAVDFGSGNDGSGGTNPNDVDTLNALPGWNGVVHFADSSGSDSDLESAPENLGGNLAFINGGLTATSTVSAVVVDQSGFTGSSLFMTGITNSIFNAIDNNITPTNGLTSSGFLSSNASDFNQNYGISGFSERQRLSLDTQGASRYGSGVSSFGEVEHSGLGSGPQLWVTGFGGHQIVDAGSDHAELDHSFSGIVLGIEKSSGSDRYGLFGGYGKSEVDIDNDAGSTDTESFFAGGYLKRDYGSHSIQFGLIAGSSDLDIERNIQGATPETAKGDTDGWFISPSVTFATPVNWSTVPLIASVRASYTGLFLDNYTESGVATPLDVSKRDLHYFNARLQLASPHEFTNRDGSTTRWEIRGGLDAQYDKSDDVDVYVSGTPMNFSANLDNEVASFLGASVNYVSADKNLSFGAFGEVQINGKGGHEAVGGLKMIMKF